MTPTVVFPTRLLDRLREARLESLPAETGGFLIGFRRGEHVEVTDATFQGAADLASRFSFERVDPAHGQQVVRVWQASSGYCSLIGDWHSHPFGPAEPSSLDKAAWKRLARDTNGMIVGLIEAGHGQPGVFACRRRLLRGGVRRLTEVERTHADASFAIRS